MGEPTIEEYMTKTRDSYELGIARPKINEKALFELKSQFLKELHDNTFSGSDNEDSAIPTVSAANAGVAIQEMAGHYKKWQDKKSNRTRSTGTFDGLAAIQAQLNNLRREIKKVNEKFKFMAEYAKRHEENSKLIKEIQVSTDAAIRNQGASIKALEIQIGKMSKMVYALSLREWMELDLEARLIGEDLILNRSLDPLYEDYVELNDFNEPLMLRRNQVDDLEPTIEEGRIVDESMMDKVITRKYVIDLATYACLLDTTPSATPLDPNKKLLTVDGNPLPNPSYYRSLVGKLLYLTITRPDLSFATQALSQFLQQPRTTLMKALIKVIRYIKLSIGQGLILPRKNNLHLTAYCNSDWASCSFTRKYVTSYGIFLGSCLMSWQSKKQTVVSKSSTEAEYKALDGNTCKVIRIQGLLKEFQFSIPIPIQMMCGSACSIAIASNPVHHSRTKHIEIDCYFVRDKIKARQIFPN
uniref:Retrovirus-related Pol polyprotein from transposon TNT 1-94 n=1 Tax=Tanacetum cinerariifolium TaxID=118510 RepID=A0A699HCB1_TANCI|nr:retrovirus-related Pol polyprotein from transposon TNT 1-94 [Tanacetum cinerariifolium]